MILTPAQIHLPLQVIVPIHQLQATVQIQPLPQVIAQKHQHQEKVQIQPQPQIKEQKIKHQETQQKNQKQIYSPLNIIGGGSEWIILTKRLLNH